MLLAANISLSIAMFAVFALRMCDLNPGPKMYDLLVRDKLKRVGLNPPKQDLEAKWSPAGAEERLRVSPIRPEANHAAVHESGICSFALDAKQPVERKRAGRRFGAWRSRHRRRE